MVSGGDCQQHSVFKVCFTKQITSGFFREVRKLKKVIPIQR